MRPLDPDVAKSVLRVGLCAVFLWFGINQLLTPDLFSGYVPAFLSGSAGTLVLVNGIAETVLGLLLLIGLYTRLVALLLGLHLLGITLALGYNEIAVRDFGLALATLSIAVGGYDKWTLDSKRHSV